MSTAARSAGALLAAGLIAGAGARGEARSHGRLGSVLYATTTRLYLDAGSREGLAPGQVIRLQRAGSCRVEQVYETRATCLGSGRVGDTFWLPEPPPPRPILRLPPLTAPAILEQRRNVLASASYPVVDYREAAGGGLEARRGSIDA